MRTSRRLAGMPEYLASALAARVAAARAAGIDVISLGVGDPDLPPPVELRDALDAAARRDDVHGYPTNRGLAELREAVAGWYGRRFGVELDPGARGHAAARREGRPRAPLPDDARPRRRRAGGRSGLPGLPRRPRAGRRRGARAAAAARARLPARPRRRARRRGAAREPAHLRLSQQPHGRRGRPGLPRAPGRVGARARRADLPRQRRTPSSGTTSGPRASCRRRGPARPGSRSTRSPRRSTCPAGGSRSRSATPS